MIDFSISSVEAMVVSAVKSTLNIAAAADSLGMPKTTLSSILSKLEKKLENQIFIRKQGSGSITITEYGQQIIPKLDKMLWISESIRPKKELELERYNAGKVSIISTQTILEGFICPYLTSFLNVNPDIEMFIRQKDELYAILPRSYEISIGCWEDNAENYVYIPFHRFRQRLWAAQEYIDQHGKIETLDDLRRCRLILLRMIRDADPIVFHDFILKQLGVSSNQVSTVNVSSTRVFDVMAEFGAGVIASSEETTRLSNLKLVPILPEISGDEVSLFVKVDRKFMETSLAKYVTDWIFKCRDEALHRIGVKPQTQYKPFFQE